MVVCLETSSWKRADALWVSWDSWCLFSGSIFLGQQRKRRKTNDRLSGMVIHQRQPNCRGSGRNTCSPSSSGIKAVQTESDPSSSVSCWSSSGSQVTSTGTYYRAGVSTNIFISGTKPWRIDSHEVHCQRVYPSQGSQRVPSVGGASFLRLRERSEPESSVGELHRHQNSTSRSVVYSEETFPHLDFWCSK